MITFYKLSFQLFFVLLLAGTQLASCQTVIPGRLPISQPFPAGRAGSEVAVELILDERETVGLELYYGIGTDPREREIVGRLSGWASIKGHGGILVRADPPPVDIFIEITRITAAGPEVILRTIVHGPKATSLSANSIGAKLVHRTLDRGKYKILAKSLRDVRDLDDLRIRFSVNRAFVGK